MRAFVPAFASDVHVGEERTCACLRACVRVCGVSASKCLSSPPGLLFVVRKQAWMSVPPLVAIG